jgi:hypothetical protein
MGQWNCRDRAVTNYEFNTWRSACFLQGAWTRSSRRFNVTARPPRPGGSETMADKREAEQSTIRELRRLVYFSRVDAIEKLCGPSRTLGQRIRASLERRRISLLERAERALVLAAVFEMRMMVRRIRATVAHRTNEGVSIAAPPGLPELSPLARSYTHICSLSMQELLDRFPWFCLLDTLPASQAFLRGAQWGCRNPDWSSDTSSKYGHSSEGS